MALLSTNLRGSHGSVPFKSPNSVKGRILSTFLQWRYKEIMWQSRITWLVSVSLLDSNPRLKFSLNIYNMHSKVIPSKPRKDRRLWFGLFPGLETEIMMSSRTSKSVQCCRALTGPRVLRDSSLGQYHTGNSLWVSSVIRSYQSLQLKQQLSHGILQRLLQSQRRERVGRMQKTQVAIPIQAIRSVKQKYGPLTKLNYILHGLMESSLPQASGNCSSYPRPADTSVHSNLSGLHFLHL